MNFEMFWDLLESLLGKEKKFKTLTRPNEFTAKFQYNENREAHVIITVNTEQDGELVDGEPRNVERREFEGLWDTAKIYPRETRFVNKGGRLKSYTRQDGGNGTTVHISYIGPLIDHIVKDKKME